MAALTTKRRNDLPTSKFALPKGTKSSDGAPAYPVDTPGRAANAKARATQMLAKGKLSPEAAAKVRHAANVVLGETDSTHHSVG